MEQEDKHLPVKTKKDKPGWFKKIKDKVSVKRPPLNLWGYTKDQAITELTKSEEERNTIGKELVKEVLRLYVFDRKNPEVIMKVLSEEGENNILRLQKRTREYGTKEQLASLQGNLAQYIIWSVEHSAQNTAPAAGFMFDIIKQNFDVAQITEVDPSTPDGELCLQLQELVLMKIKDPAHEAANILYRAALSEYEILAKGAKTEEEQETAYNFPYELDKVQIFKKAGLKQYLITHIRLVREEEARKQ